MFGKKTQPQSVDLTTPENVKKGQKVYDRIVTGECKDVVGELEAAYSIKIRRR